MLATLFQLRTKLYRNHCLYTYTHLFSLTCAIPVHDALIRYEYTTITTTVTTTTATTATATTTTTATSTTNTIIQNLQSQLSGVNKLIEEQVVKNEVHVTRLEGTRLQRHLGYKLC